MITILLDATGHWWQLAVFLAQMPHKHGSSPTEPSNPHEYIQIILDPGYHLEACMASMKDVSAEMFWSRYCWTRRITDDDSPFSSLRCHISMAFGQIVFPRHHQLLMISARRFGRKPGNAVDRDPPIRVPWILVNVVHRPLQESVASFNDDPTLVWDREDRVKGFELEEAVEEILGHLGHSPPRLVEVCG